MKANPHPEILQLFHEEGLSLECVSRGEVERVLRVIKDIDRTTILFTPNFAPRAEYAWALEQGLTVTLDNLHPLQAWPELFRRARVFVRIDSGHGRGHHDHVRTAGVHSKFGIPLFELNELKRLALAAGCSIVGLHAHTGSGILDVANWAEVGELLAGVAAQFPDVRTLNLGGGLGVPEKPGQPHLDLESLGKVFAALRKKHEGLALWIEPGRYLVAEAGVLLAQVTQVKGKGEVNYIGIATGMNSLIRPALYGSHHEIVNLTRLSEPATVVANVVGPICESGDQLGSDRLLPPAQEGDVMLIANAGAYGHAMSSHYNLREPAQELLISGNGGK